MVNKLHYITLFLIIFISGLFFHGINAQVTGRVTDANQQPIPQVNIIIKNTDRGMQTDSQGEYAIDAYPGDVLVFSHLGMQAEEVRIQRNSYVINVEMESVSLEIEEVEISKKAKVGFMTQKELLKEYPENKHLIKTSMGILDRDLSSTAFRIIDGNDMVPGGRDFLNSLGAHVPQMTVIRGQEGTKVYLRNYSGSPSTALFDVDGFLTPSPPTYLTAGDIDRIAILQRNAAITRYGPQGSAGVIVINTKAQTWMDDMGVDRSEEHSAFLDRIVRTTHYEPYSPFVPSYLEKLRKVRSEKKALTIAADQQNSYLNNPYYFLEMYDFFLSRWGNNEKPKELSRYITENFSEDIPVLKALAYLKQLYGFHLDALSIYTEILKSQSWYAQPLRDVANTYAEVGDYEKAWMYYIQYIDIMDQLPNASFDAYGKDLLITTEMTNIFERKKEGFVDSKEIWSGKINEDPLIRLVFEWNNKEAGFEIQFVTPEGFYDTWSNKPGEDVTQKSGAGNGYSSHQFFIGKENIGLWPVNIDYKGNRSEMPTYLKVSVYRDYGLPSQQVDIKVFKLSEIHGKVQLFTLQQS